MGALLLLALLAGYVWVTSKICKRVRPYWVKVLVVVVAILIPTADAIYGRIKLKQMCEAEGGLHIYRVVENVEGFGYLNDEPYEKWLRRGFKYVEGVDRKSCMSSRMTLREDGTVALEVGANPISKYVYNDGWVGDHYKDIFYRTESVIQVKATEEILSRATNIFYAGGWFERSFLGGGSVARCSPFIIFSSEQITKTLKPIQPASTQSTATQ